VSHRASRPVVVNAKPKKDQTLADAIRRLRCPTPWRPLLSRASGHWATPPACRAPGGKPSAYRVAGVAWSRTARSVRAILRR